MEDDIYTMATEPINVSGSNIYEEETQAIIAGFESSSLLHQSEQMSPKSSNDSYCDASPTQRLDHSEKEKYIGRYLVQTPEESKAEDQVDSDCETIPASPVFSLDPIDEDIQIQREDSHISLVEESCKPQFPASRIPGPRRYKRCGKTAVTSLIQEDEDVLDYPTQPLFKKKEVVVSDDDSMNAPTQRLPQVKQFKTTAEDLNSKPTQKLPQSTKVDNATGTDAPMQKLPETNILVTMTDERSMEAPTEPLTRARKAFVLSDNENSMDAPTQPLPPERKVCSLTYNKNSLDAPTQPLPIRSKRIAISDNEDSMDAVTPPLAKSQYFLPKKPSCAIPSSGFDSDSEESLGSPTIDLGLQLPLVEDSVTSPNSAIEDDDETQRIDFDPQSLFDPCQGGALSSVSPVPFCDDASLKQVNASSAASTPYQTKKKLSRVLNASSSRTNSDGPSLNLRENYVKGTYSDNPSEQKDEESDVETLPGSPELEFGTHSDIVPCSQAEELSSAKCSSVWRALQHTGGPGNEKKGSGAPETSALSSPDASPKKAQGKHTEENQPETPKVSDPKAQHHSTVLSGRDETSCESPVFDFDDTSEAIVDETQAAPPTSYSFHGTPPVIAETPYIRDGESPSKKRKIIRRSGYTISDSTFLQISTASEDILTEKVLEEISTPNPPQHLHLGSESEQSDLELTFASHYSLAPMSSKEPFVGFTNDDKKHSSNSLKLIRKIIDTDEKEFIKEEQKRQSSTSNNLRRSSRRPVPNLQNSSLYEMNASGPSGQSKPKRTSSVSNSAVDMDIASSDEGEQKAFSVVARRRRTVSKTPSTTNVSSVDMEIATPDGEQGQGEDAPKHGVCVESRRLERSSGSTTPWLIASISPEAGDQAAERVPEPVVTKGAPKPIRKTRSKRSSDGVEMIPEPCAPKTVHAGESKQIESECSDQKTPPVFSVETSRRRGNASLSNTRMKISSDSGKKEKIDRVNATVGSRDEEAALRTEIIKVESSSSAAAEQPSSRKKQVTRKAREKTLNNKLEDAAQFVAHPIKSEKKVDHFVEHPVPSEDEALTKRGQTRGRISRRASGVENQAADHQSSVSTATRGTATVQPVFETVENVNKQQPEPQSKPKGTRPRKKGNSSAASKSPDDAVETKQTAVTSGDSNEGQVDNGKTTGHETFHQPELPVRKSRRRRVGSDASTVSNSTVRSGAESSDEAAATSNHLATRKGVVSAESAESSSDEHTTGKRIRRGSARLTRTSCLRNNETSALDSTPQPSTPSAPKRGRGRPSKKDALNDSVSSSSGVGTSQRRPPRLSNLNASVSGSPSLETSRRRKRALAGQVRVLFTVIDDENDRETVARLGGKVVTHFKDCSVLVTDRIRRTVKFLCCVGLGVPIVGLDWLEKCRASGKFLDPWLYLLRDEEGEEKFNFKLAHSLRVASETPLLSGFIFHATPGVKPPPAEMQEIVDACGGFYVEENDKSIENKFVVSTVEDKKIWSRLKRRGAKLVDKEAILTGVLQQSFEPENFTLDS